MKKINIIKKNDEFNYIINNGKKYYSELFYLYILKNNFDYNRYGISVSKKIGNAVVRNKYKRRIKFVIDNLKINFKGHNIVIISRPRLKFSDYNYLKNNIVNLFNMIGEKNEKK